MITEIFFCKSSAGKKIGVEAHSRLKNEEKIFGSVLTKKGFY